jgi:hypothetical protein
MPKVQGSYQGFTSQPQFPTYQTAGMLQPSPQVPANPSTPSPQNPSIPPITYPPVSSNPSTPYDNPTVPQIPPTITPGREQLVEAVMGLPSGKRVSILRPTRNSVDGFRDIDTYNQGLMDHYK